MSGEGVKGVRCRVSDEGVKCVWWRGEECPVKG